jgi:preprotein translocase subunit SecY
MGAKLNKSLFFLGIFSHLTAGWILNIFFLLFDQEKTSQEKIQKLRSSLSRILTFLIFVASCLLCYLENVKGS